jgi:hypothetical protein
LRKRPPFSSEPYYRSNTPTAPDVSARGPIKGDRLRLTDALVEAVGKIVQEKLQPLHHEIRQLQRLQKEVLQHETELLRGTRKTRRNSLDARKVNIAAVIKSPAYPKITAAGILRKMDQAQERYPGLESYKPPPEWGVRRWSEMIGKNKAQKYISAIRADPRYLPSEYLTPLGKKRFRMNRE